MTSERESIPQFLRHIAEYLDAEGRPSSAAIVREAAAALSAQSAPDGWSPLDTFPRDGRTYLIQGTHNIAVIGRFALTTKLIAAAFLDPPPPGFKMLWWSELPVAPLPPSGSGQTTEGRS